MPIPSAATNALGAANGAKPLDCAELAPAFGRAEPLESAGKLDALQRATSSRIETRRLDGATRTGNTDSVSITLEFDEDTLASLPLGPGERERHMQIELACRFYAKGWLSLGQAARTARLDRYAFGAELAERGIPRQYSADDLEADLRYAGGQ